MIRKAISVIVCMTLLAGGTVNTASAAVITTHDFLAQESHHALATDVDATLARADVQQAMVMLGVDPEQARARVAGLSPDEVSQLQAQLDTLPAGGSVLALVGAVFVVLMILELTGVINIFKGP